MDKYIKEDEVIKTLEELQDAHEHEMLKWAIRTVKRNAIKSIKEIPTADVCPVMEVEEAVDEAIRILNAINASGRMDYGDYSKLHDAICTISNNCGAEMSPT